MLVRYFRSDKLTLLGDNIQRKSNGEEVGVRIDIATEAQLRYLREGFLRERTRMRQTREYQGGRRRGREVTGHIEGREREER